MYKARVSLIILAVLAIPSISNAFNIFYVDVEGPNDPGTGSSGDPFRKIQDAIDAAADGDIVEIRPGTYTGEGNYDLDPGGKGVTICSADPYDPSIVASTIIDPNRVGRALYFHSGEDPNCVVSGLTIRNGYTGDKGGGVFCYYSSPTVSKCIISGNEGGLHGGAAFFQHSSSELIACIITDNSAVLDGGALECWSSGLRIVNCVISNNRALNGNGGGVDCFNSGDVTVTNCTIAKNSADFGGGLYCWGSSVAVNNSILWANGAEAGPQVALQPYASTSSTVSISYTAVQGGETAVYDPCEGLVWGSNGNIGAEPYFASFDASGDPNMWDFRLQSASGRWEPNIQDWVSDTNTSPCIDAGDPNSEWVSEPWPNGGRINMGAHGGTSEASMNGNAADFDISGTVNFYDFAQFSPHWLAEEKSIEDLSLDGVVEFADLRLFAENWLWHRK